jgi:transcriptional regulator with XRE-family HTH domain
MEKTIGQNIQQFRKEASLTQEQLADKLLISPQAVSKWENDISYPDITILLQLADILHVTVDDILGKKKPETLIAKPEEIDTSKLMLKIRVLSKDGDTVNVNLPFTLIEMLINNETLAKSFQIGGKDAFKDIDLKQVAQMVSMGVIGKLVDIKSADGDIVEIYVE